LVQVTIRNANAKDAGLLAELGSRTFEETFSSDNTPEDMAAYLASSFSIAQQSAELAHPDSTFLIAEVDGVAAGYAKLQGGKLSEAVKGARPTHEWLGQGGLSGYCRDTFAAR
jgi:hypothetical protein